MKNKFLFITIVLSLFFLSVKAQNPIAKTDSLTTLPDVDVYDMNGVHTTLCQLAKNKILFFDCWFIPCPPCFIAMGPLHKIYSEYANNKDLCFITICMTDSAQVKQFIRQDTAMHAYLDQYEYFSGRRDFKLPVYFMNGCSSRIPVGVKILSHFEPNDHSKCPDAILKFQGYPTCMLFDKTGKLIFKKTGVNTVEEYKKDVTSAIDLALAKNK